MGQGNVHEVAKEGRQVTRLAVPTRKAHQGVEQEERQVAVVGKPELLLERVKDALQNLWKGAGGRSLVTVSQEARPALAAKDEPNAAGPERELSPRSALATAACLRAGATSAVESASAAAGCQDVKAYDAQREESRS